MAEDVIPEEWEEREKQKEHGGAAIKGSKGIRGREKEGGMHPYL